VSERVLSLECGGIELRLVLEVGVEVVIENEFLIPSSTTSIIQRAIGCSLKLNILLNQFRSLLPALRASPLSSQQLRVLVSWQVQTRSLVYQGLLLQNLLHHFIRLLRVALFEPHLAILLLHRRFL
jgi:hypothetical protein